MQRSLLIGDPDQLASVEVGTVLADIVKGMQNQARRDTSIDLSASIKLDNTAEKIMGEDSYIGRRRVAK